MTVHSRPHEAAKWRSIGDTGRIWVGVYPDGTARLSIRPTREFQSPVMAKAQGNPRQALMDGTVEECERVAAILEPVMLHAVRWIESQRGHQ